MRDYIWDQPKSLEQLKKEYGKCCSIPGCGQPLTAFKGLGQDLCREHQLFQIEYGGMGRKDRPHTFHRTWTCGICGWDAWNDPRFAGLSDEDKSRVIRILMHGHHSETRKADGGDDSAENTVGICVICHAMETVKNKDYLRERVTS